MTLDRHALPDPRNADIQIWVGDGLRSRAEAKVSVFDSSVQGGDAVWEGLRVYDGGVFRLSEHLARLEDSAAAMAFASVPSREFIGAALCATLRANGMRDGAHVRLTLTRGTKLTSGMSPHWNTTGPTLIVLAEWKPPVFESAGIRLVTSQYRRNPPQCLPSTIHHNNLVNNILAKIEANAAGVDDALMLDIDGFVAETNATNLFLVQDGALITPLAGHCLPGITRSTLLQLARDEGLQAVERQVRLEEFAGADEVISTGTMGELTPVIEIDGAPVGTGAAGPVLRRLQASFAALVAREREPLPI